MELKINNKKGMVGFELLFDQKEWESEIDAAYAATAGSFNVQGFRKGKAPRGVIEKTHGSGIFTEEAMKTAFAREYNNILKEHPEIKPVDYPRVMDWKVLPEGTMKIKAEVDVEPEFTLGKYTGFEIKKQKIAVTDKDITEFLENSASMRARQVAADKGYKLKKGDIAVIDFVGSVDGVEFEGGKGENHELEIGSKSFIDGFEDQLIGAECGKVIAVNVTFPKEYHAQNLAGKPAKFVVTVKNILLKQIPEINDQFAKESSEYDNLADWKKQIRENLEKTAGEKAEKETENELLKKIVDQTKIEIPEKLVEMQLDGIMQDVEHRLSYQGMTLEIYAQYMGTTIEDLREQYRERATTSIKSRLIFDAIAEKEKINVSVEKLDEEVKRIAGTAKKKPAEISKNRAQMEWIEQNLKFDRILDFLKKNNKIGG